MGWQVKVTKTLTEDEIEQYIKDYFKRYHPNGYGTYIDTKFTNSDGTVTVVISRSRSCD